MLNDFFLWLGIDAWRYFLAAFLLPPVPFIVLALVGARLMFKRRLIAWFVIVLALAGIWASCTNIVADGLSRWLLPPHRSLSAGEVSDLNKAPRTAIVVLGAGRKTLAPEYGVSDLSRLAIDRLRYGLWLSRETSLPVLFSGGVGHGAEPGPSEAEIAARVAERDFQRPLRWQESASRDTRENALKSVALLKGQDIDRIVVVTHYFHIARAMDNFRRAGETQAPKMQFVAAPMGIDTWKQARPNDFVPTWQGYQKTWLVLHEWLGRLIGA